MTFPYENSWKKLYAKVKYVCFFALTSCFTEYTVPYASSAFLILLMKARIRTVQPIKRRVSAYDFGMHYHREFLVSVGESLLLFRFELTNTNQTKKNPKQKRNSQTFKVHISFSWRDYFCWKNIFILVLKCKQLHPSFHDAEVLKGISHIIFVFCN